MDKWEYKLVVAKADTIEADLNRLGKEGWMSDGMCRYDGWCSVLMKRRLP